MSLQFEIETDRAGLRAVVRNDIRRALPILSQQILADCNYFCKQDQSGLINSSITASDIDHGDLVWDTAYAAMQYFLPSAVKDVNPNAASMWCHKACEVYGKDWEKLLQKLLEE